MPAGLFDLRGCWIERSLFVPIKVERYVRTHDETWC